MPDLICEEISRKAGFLVSVGNWIAPDGALICGTDYDTHHWETILKYFGGGIETDNQLKYVNDLVFDGFIRLVFRADVCLHVGATRVDDLWSEQPNYCRMISVLGAISNMEDVDIHIFSLDFYVIGRAKDIVHKKKGELQIEEKK